MKIKILIPAIILIFSLSAPAGDDISVLMIAGGAAVILVSDIGTSYAVKTSGDMIADQQGSFLYPYLGGLIGGGVGALVGLKIGTKERVSQSSGIVARTTTVSALPIYVGGALGLVAGNIIGYVAGPATKRSKVSYSIAPIGSSGQYGLNITCALTGK